MEPYIFVVLLLIVSVIIFKLFLSSNESFDDIYLNVGIEKYIPNYLYGNGYYGYNYGYGCLSPYCRRRSWWYNQYTPLPWNNPTRFPSWIYPPYAQIADYYRYNY